MLQVILYLLLCLKSAHAQLPSCSSCLGDTTDAIPVCTTTGITLPSPCLAKCQGLEVQAIGACDESDPLHGGVFVPRSHAAPPTSVAKISKSSPASGDSGSGGTGSSSGGSVSQSWMNEVVSRYSGEGFLYTGHVKVTHEGPSGKSPATGFVSRLSFASSGGDGSTTPPGSGSGSVEPPPPSGSPPLDLTQLSIRGVRVSADGAVYLEAQARRLQLDSLPRSGRTRTLLQSAGGSGGGGGNGGRSSSSSEGSPYMDVARVLELAAESSGSSGAAAWRADGMSSAAAIASAIQGEQQQQQELQRRQLVDDSYRADVMSWPHNVIGQLTFSQASGTYLCSGTWVSPYDVLTAAHCVFDMTRNVSSRAFVFEPGKIGSKTPGGSFEYRHVSFYRAEYPRVGGGGVNYYDIALIRMKSPTTSYMGIKYDCSQTDYPKTQTCGYYEDASWEDHQQCDDCYYVSNACDPLLQPINSCYTVGGQSGSPIYDLTDHQILGVLSGGLSGDEYADYSFWTPIDVIHFTTLQRWLWKSGGPQPPAIMAAVPPPPLDLSCAASEEGQLRLAEPGFGPQGALGRAEVCTAGQWGLVCSSKQEDEAANAAVACRELGYSSGIAASAKTLAGPDPRQRPGLQPTCAGGEDRLAQCPHSGSLGRTCKLPLTVLCEDAAIDSGSTPPFNVTANAYLCGVEGAVRLQGTGYTNWGRVEFCRGGQWGSVCHDGWDDNDAAVVCRQLGYPYGIALKGAVAHGLSPPGPESMRIWLQQVSCNGSEPGLASCATRVPPGSSDCGHRWDAGVACSRTPPGAPGVVPITSGHCSKAGAVQVISDPETLAPSGDIVGRLEVCYAQNWGSVCAMDFSSSAAAQACLQLGYKNGRVVPANQLPGEPIWMSKVRCELAVMGLSDSSSTLPNRLTTCAFTGMEFLSCPFGAVAGIQCTNSSTFKKQKFPCSVEGALRLRGGPSASAGRLEVCRKGAWQTRCLQGMTTEAVEVACRQLGFTSGDFLTSAIVPAGHPDSTNWYDTLTCTGNEARLVDCRAENDSSNAWSCTQYRTDIGIACWDTAPAPPPSAPEPEDPRISTCATAGQLRLLDEYGRTMYDKGRLEICLSGQWGTVCGNGFSQKDATVACRHLGFDWGTGYTVDASKVVELGTVIFLRRLNCAGSEARLTECPSSKDSPLCSHEADAAVQCFWNATQPPPGVVSKRPPAPAPAPAPSTKPPLPATQPPKLTSPSPPPPKPSPRSSPKPPPPSPPPPKPSPRVAPKPPSPSPPPPKLPSPSPPLSKPPSSSPPPPKSPSPSVLPPKPRPPLPSPGSTIRCKTPGTLRLSGGNVVGSGMLQYCADWGDRGTPVWGSVCSTSTLSPTLAAMACRNLGYLDGFAVANPSQPAYGATGLYYTFRPNPDSMPVWFRNPNCPRNATCLSQCSSASTSCSRESDVALVCLRSSTPQRRYGCAGRGGWTRLISGATSTSRGTVQVCYGGVWGTVCDDGWDDKDATVACRQMGFSRGVAVNATGRSANGTSLGRFPAGPQDMRVWFTKLECSGGDKSLVACSRPRGANLTSACVSHSGDAGAVCFK